MCSERITEIPIGSLMIPTERGPCLVKVEIRTRPTMLSLKRSRTTKKPRPRGLRKPRSQRSRSSKRVEASLKTKLMTSQVGRSTMVS